MWKRTIPVLIQIVEANGTLQPTHDSRKSDGADGAVIIAASRWQHLLVFLLLILLLSCLLLGTSFSAASFLRKWASLAFTDSLYVESILVCFHNSLTLAFNM
jgi:hypothetical protein